MSVRAVVLFGSQARSDQGAASDTDLLFITEGQETQHTSQGHTSMFFYAWSKLLADARDGDLFVCHIAKEAKPIFDPEALLTALADAFVFRNSYAPAIEQARDFGWYLARYGVTLNRRLLVKRIIWCVRTILVARSAERRQPVFAPHLLAELSPTGTAGRILLGRHSLKGDTVTRQMLADFLSAETEGEPFLQAASQADFIKRFEDTGNRVALQTLEQQAQSDAAYR